MSALSIKNYIMAIVFGAIVFGESAGAFLGVGMLGGVGLLSTLGLLALALIVRTKGYEEQHTLEAELNERVFLYTASSLPTAFSITAFLTLSNNTESSTLEAKKQADRLHGNGVFEMTCDGKVLFLVLDTSCKSEGILSNISRYEAMVCYLLKRFNPLEYDFFFTPSQIRIQRSIETWKLELTSDALFLMLPSGEKERLNF